MSNIAETLARAWQQHQAGNVAQAQQLYLQILQTDPSNVDARCLLGAACQALGNAAEAETHYRRALQLWPGHGMASNGLGILLAQQNKLDEAAAAFEQLIRAQPGDADAHNNLGSVRLRQGQVDDAIACFRRSVELRPQDAQARANLDLLLKQRNLPPERPAAAPVAADPAAARQAEEQYQQALTLSQAGRTGEALALLRRSVELRPDHAGALTLLGHTLAREQKYAEAITCYRRALALAPDSFEAHYILALALQETGNQHEAVTHFRHAVRVRPDLPDPYNCLGTIFLGQGKFEEGIQVCQEAIRLRPDFAEAHSNLGCIYLKQARLREAMASLRQGLKSRPDMAPVRSNLLFCMNYDPEADPAVIFAEHQEWGRLHTPAVPPRPHANDRDPARRLRVGYASPDLRFHALTRYFEPVLAGHDPKQVETFCYSENGPDAVTLRLQGMAHAWHLTGGLTDAQFVQRVRDDRIDILVDLAGHSAGNRLLAFAHKPAPVQATWLGYINTTGLKAIDYRLTDAVMDPPEAPVRDTEELARLPGGFCCFAPPADAGDVSPLPALAARHLTFGSLNNSFKFNDRVYDLWCRVLRALPGARLLMFRDTLKTGVREQLRKEFADRGVGADRLDLREWSGAPGYLRVYDEIDVSLDTFPVTGGVTTCESLWMGVPVLTLCGVRPAGRHSASLMTRVGLADWVAQTPDEFVDRAVRASAALDDLAQVRAVLRDRMKATVCDAQRLTRELEEAYRVWWQKWCKG